MSADRFTIRREALTSEVAQTLILELNAELSGRYPEEGSPSHFRLDVDEVAEGRGAFLVVRQGEDVLACGAVRRLDAETAELKRMYVRPTARGLGLGHQLLEALEAEAHRLGVRRLVLETGPRQPEAIGLYEYHGFSRVSAFGHYEDHPLSVFMAKDL